jgi:hypothetical protein
MGDFVHTDAALLSYYITPHNRERCRSCVHSFSEPLVNQDEEEPQLITPPSSQVILQPLTEPAPAHPAAPEHDDKSPQCMSALAFFTIKLSIIIKSTKTSALTIIHNFRIHFLQSVEAGYRRLRVDGLSNCPCELVFRSHAGDTLNEFQS